LARGELDLATASDFIARAAGSKATNTAATALEDAQQVGSDAEGVDRSLHNTNLISK